MQKRLTRAKRQAEIAEDAKNESRDQSEIDKRANLLVQRLWSSYFKKQMEKEMNKYAPIEIAFQQIRATTGNSDVKMMVHKFMTKEETYAQLLRSVNENEKKYDDLKSANEQKRAKLLALQIANDNRRSLNQPTEDDDEHV